MDETSNLDKLFGQHSLPELAPALAEFWFRFEKVRPEHSIFEKARSGELILSQTLPLMIHSDEGRGLKKRAVFLMQWQICFGKGVGRKNAPAAIQQKLEELKLQPNFKGHSFATRFLSLLMPRSVYAADAGALQDAMEFMCQDLAVLGSAGIKLQSGHLWLCPIGVKGDWSNLVDIGRLTQSYRNSPKTASSKIPDKAMCHLCAAGTAGHPFEDVWLGLAVG